MQSYQYADYELNIDLDILESSTLDRASIHCLFEDTPVECGKIVKNNNITTITFESDGEIISVEIEDEAPVGLKEFLQQHFS